MATASGLACQYALENAGSTGRQSVRNAPARLRVQTFFGTIRFDAGGADVYKSMADIQIQYGRPVTVYPPDLATARLVYPAPPSDGG
jgi:branched-chain amino acid transport system substrate-binding protein